MMRECSGADTTRDGGWLNKVEKDVYCFRFIRTSGEVVMGDKGTEFATWRASQRLEGVILWKRCMQCMRRDPLLEAEVHANTSYRVGGR